MSRIATFIVILFLLILILAGAWWWLFFEKGTTPVDTNTSPRPQAFTPLNPTSPIPQQPTGTSTTPVEQGTTSVDVFVPKKIRKLYATPVAFGISASSTASSSNVFFVDRGTGHIYNMDIEAEKPTKISNTTILRVFESIFDTKTKNVVLRYIKEGSDIITTVFAPINTDIRAKNATNNIQEVVLSPKGDRLFSLEKTNAGAVGYISKIDGSSKVLVFESPFYEWLATWPEEGVVAVTTKASYLRPGFLFFINTKTGASQKILGPIYGLTTNVSKDAKKVLYSDALNGTLSTKVLNLTDSSITSALFQTMPEKCVWSALKKTSMYCAVPNEPYKNMPDAWYKGLVDGVDQLWHLDTATNSTNKISNLLEDTDTLIDAVNPTLDPNELALFFINNYDLSLWSLDLRE
jgi:cytoskeletal protein RodZ